MSPFWIEIEETRRLVKLAEECIGESSVTALTRSSIQAGIDALVQAAAHLTLCRESIKCRESLKRVSR